MKKKIYIAGPYTSAPKENTEAAIFVAELLSGAGYIPFIPHLTHYWEALHHHEYEFWMEQDIEWLKVCDAVLRLPGESKGADQEAYVARYMGKPVYYSLYSLVGEVQSDPFRKTT